jgi:DNA primase
MSLSPQFLDELRARTLLSSVIGRQVKLSRAGREWKACCPFHNEKTPSFTINDEKGFYHCFGCGAHGDAIRFLTDARGLPFMDAVKELADAAGMEVPAPDPRAQQKAERAKDLYDVMVAASHWFEEQLGGIDGDEARKYLQQRGISDATRKCFNFGYAPDSRNKLKIALRDFGPEKLIEAGLLIEADDGKEPYDRFRGRLMIPIRDQRGRIIAFGGRNIGQGEPKYLNSPETPLFDKGRTLYNLDRAGPASRETRRVIVVEGYMDVIALDQAGIAEAVAPLGTALTEGQLGKLWRMVGNPILCFDGDSAGQKAAIRAALRALPHVAPGRSLDFITLPAGQDPDDLIRAGGREALEQLLERPEPLVDRLWRYESNLESLATPEQRAGLRRRLIEHVSAISDQDVRDQYRHELLERFNALTRPRQQPWSPGGNNEKNVWKKGSNAKNGRFVLQRPLSMKAKAIGSSGLSPHWTHWTRAVLDGLLHFPEIIASHAEAISALVMSERTAARLRNAMLEAAMEHGELDQEQLNTILAAMGMAPLIKELGLKQGLDFSFTRRDADPERARRDLVLIIDTLAARPGMEAAMEAATVRLKEQGDKAAFEEQQRLRAAWDEANRKLAALTERPASEA